MILLLSLVKKATSILYYLFFYIIGFPLFLFAAFIWLLTVGFDKRLYVLHLYTQIWTSFYFLIIPNWKIKVIGKEKIDNRKPLVFVSNHQSEFDIIVMSHLFAHFKWVSKAEVFKLPIFGWNMSLNKYIKLKRGDRKSILQMVKDCILTLEKGSSVFIFPEGTRSKTGQLRNFSSGAFIIAQRAKVGIQPIVINGTKNIIQKGSWMLNFKANVTLEVLDEIPYDTLKDLDSSELATMVRNQIAEKVKDHH